MQCVGEAPGPCQPSTPFARDLCNNACDDDRDGTVDDGCAGQETFDYCERNASGGYTRWTCGCGDGLNVGYCLGSGDPQDSCGGATGCLMAPAFATSGVSQAGGDFRCCVSSVPCSSEGYVDEAFHCGTNLFQRFECAPDAIGCEDSNQCDDLCLSLDATINHSTGEPSGHGISCQPNNRSVCSAAQGGLGSADVSAMEQAQDPCGRSQVTYQDGTKSERAEVYCVNPPIPGASLLLGRRDGRTGQAEGGGGGGGGRGGSPSPSPKPNQCGPAPAAAVSSALSAMASPRVSLSDQTTRYSQVDVGLQGSLGGFNFARQFVSNDKTWVYLSMLGNDQSYFLPRPFGTSPSNRNSLHWWHNLYSFVYARGRVPGVSTWAVRDTDGAILEYEACDPGTTGCFAKPRTTTRWSTAQLFWTQDSGGYFVLVKPGEGRFIYKSGWSPIEGAPPAHYFLTWVDDDVLNGAGGPRTRLRLQYAAPPLSGCPGASGLGNGVPYLDTVTTEDGATLKFHYKLVYSRHNRSPLGPYGRECVLSSVALRDNPNASSTVEKVVAEYRYHYSTDSMADDYAGALSEVYYPETSDLVTYRNKETTWSVELNNKQVGAHTYTSEGKVSAMTSMSGGTQVLSTTTCPVTQSGGCVEENTITTEKTAGDRDGSMVTMKRQLLPRYVEYMPYMPVVGYVDTCAAGNCTGFTSGSEYTSWSSLEGGFLYLASTQDMNGQKNLYIPTLADAGTAHPSVPQPVAQETRIYGVSGSTDAGVYTETTQTLYGSFPNPGTPEPFRLVEATRDERGSVLVPGQKTTTITSYHPWTRRLKSFIQEGYTETFDTVAGMWSGPKKVYVGTFYFNHHKCLGAQDTGGGQVLEVHGPCAVSGAGATDCDMGTDFPITQYHYYEAPPPYGNEASNRANRLREVTRFVRHNGPNACAGFPALRTTFNDYDARGNVTRMTDAQGVQTLLEYQGGRLHKSTTTDGQRSLTSTYWYDAGQLLAVGQPTGTYRVRCHRDDSVLGQGCGNGPQRSHVTWEAIASDEKGVNWTEGIYYRYWGLNGPLKSVEYRTRANGETKVRRVVTYHPDAHGRPTYTRWGWGENPGSFASTAGFDAEGKPTGVGLPFNEPPDFCKGPPENPTSKLCTALGYDTADRLTQATQFFSDTDTDKQVTTFAYDAHGQVSTIRSGCESAENCQAPVQTYQYDDFGNLLQAKLPHANGYAVRYSYDARGNLLVKQNELMRQAAEWVQYSYDALARLKDSTRHVTSGPTTTTPHDEVLFRLGYDDEQALPIECGLGTSLNSNGRLRFREDSFGRTWYRYDTLGRLVGELRQRQGESDTSCPLMLQTQYTYDDMGRPVEMTYPYGRTVSYIYGTGANADRITGLNVTLFTSTSTGTVKTVHPVLTNIAWEPFGGLRGYQLNPPSAPALEVAVEYAQGDDGSVPPADCSVGFPSMFNSDRTGRLRSLRVSTGPFIPGAGSGDIYKRTYTWKADQVVRTDTCLLGATMPRTEMYAYDRTLRLTEASRPTGNFETMGGAFLSQSFDYDRRGNRITLTEAGGARSTRLVYGQNSDRLFTVTPQNDLRQRVSYSTDTDGRVARKDSARYGSGQVVHRVDLRYRPTSNARGWGSAREDVFRTVSVNGAVYGYFYDALGRRRAKVNPFGVRDEYFHSPGNALLVDQGWSDVLNPSFRTVDDYVWLAGRPVVLLRGRLGADGSRQPDTSPDCRRNGEAAACGAYFPVTDHIGKPVLMLDSAGKVTGSADYEPFGHVNRVTLHDSTPSTYYTGSSPIALSTFRQPPENAQVQVRMRALYQFVDTQSDGYVQLMDADTQTELARHGGPQLGRVVTNWLTPSAGRISAQFLSGTSGTTPSTNIGVAVEGYEYQRYQTGAQPFWTPLRFPGQYHDAETDFFENWNRYYDPSIGRYLQPEPLLATEPGALPAYAYSLNNPLWLIDTNGLEPSLAIYATERGAVLAGFAYIRKNLDWKHNEIKFFIIRSGNNYLYTTPTILKPADPKDVCKGGSLSPPSAAKAVCHTHPAGCNRHFSPPDKDASRSLPSVNFYIMNGYDQVLMMSDGNPSHIPLPGVDWDTIKP
jgi:RHS repeat-associated protein